MANDNYINTRIRPALHSPLDSRINALSSVSFLSDSTFCETEFECLDSTQIYENEQYKDYSRLSKDTNSTQEEAFNANDVIGNIGITSVIKTSKLKGRDQFINSRSQHSVLYANNDMLRSEREDVAPPIPRRKGRGRRIARRMSTIPSSVWHEVYGWPRLKTATVSLVSLVIGAGLCILFYFAYKFIVKVNEGNHCKVLEELKDCRNFIQDNDETKTFVKFSAKCSKIQKKFIKDQKYVIYEDRVSYVEAMDFCHRVVHLIMVRYEEEECKRLKNHSVIWNKATGFWIGNWYRPYNEMSLNNNRTSSWYTVNPKEEFKLLADDSCAYIQSHSKRNNENCYSASKCLEKADEKFPICKC